MAETEDDNITWLWWRSIIFLTSHLSGTEAVPLVGFTHLAFTCKPADSWLMLVIQVSVVASFVMCVWCLSSIINSICLLTWLYLPKYSLYFETWIYPPKYSLNTATLLYPQKYSLALPTKVHPENCNLALPTKAQPEHCNLALPTKVQPGFTHQSTAWTL